MSLNEQILDILACPKCRGGLRLTESGHGLVCDGCKLLYPVDDGIPVLLVEDAKPVGAGNGADQAG